ncbi:MAG TPA: LacI family DNA-binding transcriptional regulator [Phnomibacter sp.]|nr:LacI family DNA-binding transcriptional regulator [Phnomibacter sp.]
MNEGRKEVTIYDIAQALDVSVATVSRALNSDPIVNKKTAKKVVEVAEKMGYRVNANARSLRKQSTNTLGVIVPRLNSAFISAAIAGMEAVANREGYNLIISQSMEVAEKEIANAQTLLNNRVDGLLVSLSNQTSQLSHFEQYQQRGTPVLFFDRAPVDSGFPGVVINNRRSAYEAVAHLIEQGCRRILHITASLNRNVYSERLAGYCDALRAAGMEVQEDLVMMGELNMDWGTEAAAAILAMDTLPDGIFVTNDNCAVGLILALRKAGVRIPEDIAVVGFNNDPIGLVVDPNLSTVDYRGYEMGETAANWLISHLRGTQDLNKTSLIQIKSALIVRQSSLRKV